MENNFSSWLDGFLYGKSTLNEEEVKIIREKLSEPNITILPYNPYPFNPVQYNVPFTITCSSPITDMNNVNI